MDREISLKLQAGEGLTGGGTSGDVTIDMDYVGLSTDSAPAGGLWWTYYDINNSGHRKMTHENLEDILDHDDLLNFNPSEHINHFGVILTAGIGLSGGGDISTNRTFNLDLNELASTTITDASYLGFYLPAGPSHNKATFSDLKAGIDLDDLGNVIALSPSVDDVLTWNGSAWVNDVVSGGGADSSIYSVDGIVGSGRTVTLEDSIRVKADGLNTDPLLFFEAKNNSWSAFNRYRSSSASIYDVGINGTNDNFMIRNQVSNLNHIQINEAATGTIYFETNTGEIDVDGWFDLNDGQGNMRLGGEAGFFLPGGSFSNTLIGPSSGRSMTATADKCIGIGANSLQFNTQPDIVGIGEFAGQNNTGTLGVFIGASAGQNNTGASVTLVGRSSGSANTGDYATIMGVNAAQNNGSNDVVAIGYRAAGSHTGTKASSRNNRF